MYKMDLSLLNDPVNPNGEFIAKPILAEDHLPLSSCNCIKDIKLLSKKSLTLLSQKIRSE